VDFRRSRDLAYSCVRLRKASTPTKSLNNKTPFEAWHERKPNVRHLKTFGCVAHVKKVGPGLDKLSDRSAKMMFIGYESGTKGYRFFNPVIKKLVVSTEQRCYL
jgi:hypothetical protein